MSASASEPSGSQAKATLNVQTEKAIHYTYLQEFRVEQCPQFLQHKCTQHKPFTCFHWHFMNQRRRRPERNPKTKSFNYSPDMYCTKYDETTGICPEGDDCLFLHRTAGDTERRYHLRYYKTGICVYDTDARGNCVKNGPHCAFAHGLHDLRNPVYDIREIQGKVLSEDGSEVDANGVLIPNLDKDRNAVGEDPRWQDANYVLTNYKTEQCKRPPRLCRQGYACPQYHNTRDKRRPPQTHKYRSTPCPSVKQGDEWGDPANCDNGEQCTYCHTRTEQQFHPEIYKSTKCNDMQQTSFCPRGPFCAFAHVDKEMNAVRDMATDATSLASMFSSVLPTSTSPGGTKSENGSVLSPIGPEMVNYSGGPMVRARSYSTSHAAAVQHLLHVKTMESALPHYQKAPGCEREEHNAMRKHRAKTMDGSAKDWTSLSGAYSFPNTVESVVGKALDDMNAEDIDVEACLSKELVEECSNPVASSLSQGLLSSGFMGSSNGLASSVSNSQPVSIPGRDRTSSPPSSIVGSLDKSGFYGSPFNANAFGAYIGQVQQSQSPSSRLWGESQSTAQGPNGSMNPVNWSEQQNAQFKIVVDSLKHQMEDAHRREKLLEQQRDEAVSQLQKLQLDFQQQRSLALRNLDLEHLTPQQIRSLQEQLRADLEVLDKFSQHHQQQHNQQERMRLGMSGPHPQLQQIERDFWTTGRGHC